MHDWSPFQLAVFDDVAHGTGHTVVDAVAGSGKCLGRATVVMLHDGSVKPVEEVEEGDLLMGPDSEPRRVLSVSNGIGPLFRIVPVKGDSWVCNDAHVLTLAGSNRHLGEVRDVALRDFLSEMEHKPRIDSDWKLWRTGVRFEHREVPVEPYLVGLWLGDGTRGEAQITNCEPEIISFCQEAAGRYGHECVVRRDDRNNTFNIRFRMGERGQAGRHTPSVLRRFFQGCELSGIKVVPRDYLVNDDQTRLELLAGLLDTDGYYAGGSYEWATVYPPLCEQILFLARSLGFAAYASDKVVGGTNYKRVCISGDLSRIPNRVARRKAPMRQQVKRVTVTGFSVEYIGKGEFFGFTLDGDGRFLLGDFTVTHNTSTIEEAVNYVPPRLSTMFVAFNKSIADELTRRLAGKRVEASTLHSYGLKTVTSGLGRLRIHKYRVEDFLRERHGDEQETRGLRGALAKAVSLAKGALAHDAEAVDAVIDAFSVELPTNIASVVKVPDGVEPRDWFVAEVVQLLDRCRDTSDGCLDFDDMVWLPIVRGIRPRQFDRLFVDERQDLSPAQLELILRAVKPDGRICAVGDENQCVYQFRGADARALQLFTERLNAKRLPLSISYRCARAIVDHVRAVLPEIPIQAAPDAPEGDVTFVSRDRMEHAKLGAQAGDFILSRTNAPLIGLCLKFLRAGRRANIQGRDVGDSLALFVKKSGAKTVEALRDHVEAWAQKECARLSAKRRDTQPVEDRASCLLELSDGAESVANVLERIEELFAERASHDVIVLSSTHKAKGLERDRVWMLVGTYMRRPDVQEMNLYYVGVTRARRTLFLVEGFEKKRRRWEEDDQGLPKAVDEYLHEALS